MIIMVYYTALLYAKYMQLMQLYTYVVVVTKYRKVGTTA